MKNYRLKTGGRIVIFALILAIIGGIGALVVNKTGVLEDVMSSNSQTTDKTNSNSSATDKKPSNSNKPSNTSKPTTSSKPEDTIYLSIDEWPGFIPIIDANGGYTTQPGSIFANKGINVEINIINDPTESSNAFITGDLNAAGYTLNRIAFLSDKFSTAGVDIVVPIFTNYSAGADGIIAKTGIDNVTDMVGKKIGVPRYSEAQSLVIWFVNNSDLTENEKRDIIDNLILFDDASAVGEAFYAGQLDIAGTWEPYLSYATNSTDAHVMFSTKASRTLIMDAITFRADFAKQYPDTVAAFMDGVFEANAKETYDFDVIREVMPMFAESSDQDILDNLADAEMVSWAENKRALKTDAPSMYAQMCGIWESIGETPNRKMGLSIFDMSYNDMIAGNHSATIIEDSDKIKVTDENRQELTDYKSMLTKSSTVDFVPDTSEFLTPNEAYEILDEFIEIAKVLDGAIIQIEGNINASNYSESGVKLSLNRANAVADYFIMNGIDPDRIITVGNGNTKMLAAIGSGNEQLNRRTDVFFKIVED